MKNRGRIQSQGEKIEKSESWSKGTPLTIIEGKINLSNLKAKKIFEKSGVSVWECRNCGHLSIGTKAPEVCPVCFHPQSYFEVKEDI